jgi:hypothetical protein
MENGSRNTTRCVLFHPQRPSGLNTVVQGLGTSTNDDAKEYFSHMGAHMIPFAKLRDEERPLIDLAFSKKKADDRKDWLRKFKVMLHVSQLIAY